MASIKLMAELLGVTPGGYHKWLKRKANSEDTPRKARQELLKAAIQRIWRKSRETYGSPRIHQKLKEAGFRVALKTVAAIMKCNGMVGKSAQKRRVTTTDSKHGMPVAQNILAREFNPDRPAMAYVADITYIRLQNGWGYLCAIIDLFNREVIGWSIANHMRTEMVITALARAMAKRPPAKGAIFHTDRGSQFASNEFKEALLKAGFIQSMSRKGNCWDNAVIESFFGTLKTEEVGNKIYTDIDEARRFTFDYIETFYNTERLHSALGYVSPVNFLSQKAA